MTNWFETRVSSGETFEIRDLIVVPQSRSYIVRTPWFGAIYSRPDVVLVDRGGEVKRIPIVDVTRLIQIGLFLLASIFLLAAFLTNKQRED